MRHVAMILLVLSALVIPGVSAQPCVDASYVYQRELMRPGESGDIVAVYVENTCSKPVSLILRLNFVETGSYFDYPVYLDPESEKTVYLRGSVPIGYEDKWLTFYVQVLQSMEQAYVIVKSLPKLKLLVFPDFRIAVSSYNGTVRAGEKALVGIWASEEAVNSMYDAIAYLISPGKRIRLQVIKLNLYPNRETKFYVDIPKSTEPETYKVHFEIYKRKYKLAESDLIVDPYVTILPAEIETSTATETITTETFPETPTATPTSPTRTPESTTTMTTQERTTSPQTASELPITMLNIVVVLAVIAIIMAAALLIFSIMLLRRRAYPSQGPSG